MGFNFWLMPLIHVGLVLPPKVYTFRHQPSCFQTFSFNKNVKFVHFKLKGQLFNIRSLKKLMVMVSLKNFHQANDKECIRD